MVQLADEPKEGEDKDSQEQQEESDEDEEEEADDDEEEADDDEEEADEDDADYADEQQGEYAEDDYGQQGEYAEDDYEQQEYADDDDYEQEEDYDENIDTKEAFQDEPTGAEQAPLFYDEEDPRYAQGGGEEVFADEGGYQDHREQKEEKRSNRRAIICCLLCCCVLILAGIGAILGLVVFGNDDDNKDDGPKAPTPAQVNNVPTSAPFQFTTPAPVVITPSPTNFPSDMATKSPTRKPSPYPTIAPSTSAAPTAELPEEIVLPTYADSSIQDGLETDTIFGLEDTLYIQNGELDTQDNLNSYAAISFDLTKLPLLAMLFEGNKTATLTLHHVPSDLERDPVEITVFRFPKTEMEIETLNSRIFQTLDKDKVKGSTFSVAPSDEQVQVDITDLVYGIDGREAETQLFLQLKNDGAIQTRKTGDTFYSREYQKGAFPPQVIFRFIKEDSAAPSGAPSAGSGS
jgi:hypothetical protein